MPHKKPTPKARRSTDLGGDRRQALWCILCGYGPVYGQKESRKHIRDRHRARLSEEPTDDR